MSGQKDIFLFGALPMLLIPERHLKVARSTLARLRDDQSANKTMTNDYLETTTC
jgi:hypothetical protein